MCKWLYQASVPLPCHFSSERGGEEMNPYFPSGQRELADWSGDCVTDSLVGLEHRLPDSPEERQVLVLTTQMDIQLLNVCC